MHLSKPINSKGKADNSTAEKATSMWPSVLAVLLIGEQYDKRLTGGFILINSLRLPSWWGRRGSRRSSIAQKAGFVQDLLTPILED